MREISAGIIIFRKTKDGLKFLLLYHGGGYWNFPKGKIESEENSFQAALREIREETGLTRHELKLDKYFKTYEKFEFWRRMGSKNIKIFKTVIFYLSETKESRIRVSEEHEGYGWLTYKEAMKILSKHKDSQGVLTQANNFLIRNQRRFASI